MRSHQPPQMSPIGPEMGPPWESRVPFWIRGWRRRSCGVLLAFSLVLVACGDDASGSTSTSMAVDTTTSVAVTATSATSSTTTRPQVPAAITGYGDFSGLDYMQLDRFLTTSLIVECMQDHGIPVTLIPPGDGIDYMPVPLDQNQQAQRYEDACRAGLNLPAERLYTPEELRENYNYWVEELIPCLKDLGYTAPELPSEDYVAENYYVDPYIPHGNVPVFELPEAYEECPISPPWRIATPDD